MSRRTPFLLLIAFVLTGCGQQAVRFAPETPGFHTVRKGDTVYSIAFRNELNWRDLAYWNDIAPPYRIDIGQKLRLTSPAAGPQVVGTTPGKTPVRTTPRPPQPRTPGTSRTTRATASERSSPWAWRR